MGSSDMEMEGNDDDCHQMVMAWTLDDWKVNVFCKLQSVTDLTYNDQVKRMYLVSEQMLASEIY